MSRNAYKLLLIFFCQETRIKIKINKKYEFKMNEKNLEETKIKKNKEKNNFSL